MTIRLGILGAAHSHLSGKVQAITGGQVEGVEIAGAYEANPAVRARRETDPTYAGARWVPRPRICSPTTRSRGLSSTAKSGSSSTMPDRYCWPANTCTSKNRLASLSMPVGRCSNWPPPGGTQARLFLEEATGEFQQGWQVVEGGPWTVFAQDLRDLAAAIRGERSPQFGPDHDFIVQETLLRAAGAR